MRLAAGVVVSHETIGAVVRTNLVSRAREVQIAVSQNSMPRDANGMRYHASSLAFRSAAAVVLSLSLPVGLVVELQCGLRLHPLTSRTLAFHGIGSVSA